MNAKSILLALLLAGPAIGADFTMPATVSVGIAENDGQVMQSELRLEPRLSGKLDAGLRWNLSLRLRLDSADSLNPGGPRLETFSSASRPLELGELGSLELRNAFLEKRLQNGLLRMGKQSIVWGNLDGIKVLDVLNPSDFREFILDDFDQSRLSLWSLYARQSFAEWRAELAVIPDTTVHQLPQAGAWFSLKAPRFRFGATPDMSREAQPVGERGTDVSLGLRISRQWPLIALSLVAYDGTDFEPLGRTDDGALTSYYAERKLFGLGAQSALGPFVLRTEIGYQPNRTFNLRASDGLSTSRLDQTRAAVGIDVSLPSEIFLNLQYLYDTIDDAPDSLVRPQTDRLITGYLRRDFGYETWLLELRWYHSLTDSDDLVRASLDYAPDDRWRFGLAIDSFSGTSAGLFGQFDKSDRVTFTAEYLF